MPWYAENDDGLEDMSDDSGDLDGGTSSNTEEGSGLCFEAASNMVLGEGFCMTRTWGEGGYYTRNVCTQICLKKVKHADYFPGVTGVR